MLKIWKQAWKKGDSARCPHSEQDSDAQDAPLIGASSGSSPMTSAAAVPPITVDDSLGPVLPRGRRGTTKRTRASDAELSLNSDTDRPRKKTKFQDEETSLAKDTLGNHLPEVIETDAAVRPETPLLCRATFEEELFEHAKAENSVAVFPSVHATLKIVADYLAWAVDLERSRPESEVPRPRRTALLVTKSATPFGSQNDAKDLYFSNVPSVRLRWSSLLQSEYSLAVGMYAESVHDASEWSNLLHNDVVIISAKLLFDSLTMGVIAMSQIHVLVFGDAQNLKDQETHPIIKVMNDFYRPTDALVRPKIFAVVISSAGRMFHFDSGMLKLEGALDAKVFGISESKRAEILALPDRPNEMIVLYSPPLRTVETRLFKQLLQFDPAEILFRRQFRAARHALAEVGSCASDLIWRRALKVIEADVSTSYEEDEDAQVQPHISPEKARARVRDTVKNWVFTMPNLDPNSRGFNVAPKFAKLVQILKSCKLYGDDFRGIVFVQKGAIAFVILDILRTLDDGLGFLRPYAVISQGKSSDIQHQQREVFQCFARGTYNLLIATKSAEDLDIPKASIVIRYDLFESQISDAFVRARTRGRESYLVFMVERGNDAHRRILSDCTKLSVEMQSWTERLFHDPGSSVPPRSLHETTNPYHSESEDDESDDYIKDPTTSGRIYVHDAITVVYRLAASLGAINDEQADPSLFEYEKSQEAASTSPTYVCTVIFPAGSPVSKVSGPSCISVPHARRAACYRACIELFDRNVLDYRLFPLSPNYISHQSAISIPSGQVGPHLNRGDLNLSPPEPNTETKAFGTHFYPRKKPDFWDRSGTANFECLYPTVITTDYSDDSSHPYSPLMILTRQPLPYLPSFRLFFSNIPGVVHLTQGASFEVDEEHLENLHQYTVRICRAIANKPFICPLDKMQYFFAPLAPTWKAPTDSLPKRHPSISNHIPWDLVTLAANSWVVPLASRSLESMTKDVEDAVIQDRWVEFTRRYEVVRMRPDLTPMSKPVDSPRELNYDNFVEYCKAHRKGFEGLQKYNQPLIEVSKVPAILNHLNPTSRPVTTSTKSPAKYLIPELCAKFTIPASTLRTALLLPSITRRIDDLLLVKELNAKFFEHSIIEHHLHAAISAPAAGNEFDYERLELLGDAFLKYLSSIYVFVTNPAQKEGTLHVHRQRIISNRSLLENANRSGLPQYIQAKPFSSRLWQPPNFTVLSNIHDNREHRAQAENEDPTSDALMPAADTSESGKIPSLNKPQSLPDEINTTDPTLLDKSHALEEDEVLAERSKLKRKSKKKKQLEDQDNQWLGDKAVADVAEAIIGAAYISGGRETALKVTKALNIPVPNIDRWSDFGRKVLAPPPNVTAKLREGSIAAVQAIIGHKFSRPHLLAQALTHASIQGHETTSYERLEFIGDAILDFMVIRHIFDRDTQLSPGGLTLLKGAMVSNSALAAVCVWSGLQQHLLFESYILASSIQAYADELKAKQAKEYELAEKENRLPGQYWLEIEPPKALSDVVESIIGAIYISEDFSPSGAEAIFDNVLKPFYDRHVTLKTLSHHPTKILFELFQAQGCQQFEIMKEKDEDRQITRCDVIVHDVVLASAQDTTAASAARRASECALDALEGDAQFLTRTCDCRTHAQARKAHKKAMKHILSGFGDEEDDLLTVEDVLAEESESQPVSYSTEGMVP